MKFILLFLISIISIEVFAKGVKVKWSCPVGASNQQDINLEFDDLGNLKFTPNIFSSKMDSVSGSQLNECLRTFQINANAAVTEFKQIECPASKDDICYASVDYVNGKLVEDLKRSKIVTKASGITISPLAQSSTQRSNPEKYLEEKIAKKQIDPKNLSQSFTYQGRSYKVSDFDKVVGDNIENVFLELNLEEGKQYAQNYMLANSGILNTETPSAKRTAVLNNLNRMFGYMYGEKGHDELTKMLECRPEDELKPIEDILSKIQESKEVSKCAQLNPGEHKLFKKENSNYYTTGNYLLKRKADGNYQAVLNVDFKQASGSVSPQAMMERSRECLAMAAPHMKGPDGKKIELVVMTPNEVKQLPSDTRPKPYDITIEGPQYGTNAGGYAEDVNCSVITHEMLHLLGLCDEYKEDRPQYAQYNWTCRVVTKVPSIMRDLSVYNKAVGSTLNCDCSGNTCKSVMNGNNESLKKMYVSGNINDVTDYKFRNKYCKDSYLNSNQASSQSPDKAVVLLSESSNTLAFESRFISSINSAPYYSKFQMKVVCTCPAGDAACIAEKNASLERIRNPGTTGFCPHTAKETKKDEGTKGPPGFLVESNILKIASSPILPSLLQPSHFNKILEGRCGGKSQGYLECAEYAYKGQPCNVPAECADDNYYLGSEQ